MNATHGYAGVCRVCGGWIMLCVDTPDMAKTCAKETAQCIRDGYEVRRVTIEEGRAMKSCPFGCPGRKSSNKAKERKIEGGGR